MKSFLCGTTFVTIIKDGKEVKRDLSKINTWSNNDPEELRISNNLKKINDILDTLSAKYNPIAFDRVRNEILSIWYNLIKINRCICCSAFLTNTFMVRIKNRT